MVNHWYSRSTAHTACGQYSGALADSISVTSWGLVSCPDCLDADYPAVSAEDMELRHSILTECDPTKHKWFSIPDPAGYVGEVCESCGQNKDNVVDAVNSPEHYRWLPVEVIEITEKFSFTLGNVLKYVMRADHKGRPLEDLKKARWYLDREIAHRERLASEDSR